MANELGRIPLGNQSSGTGAAYILYDGDPNGVNVAPKGSIGSRTDTGDVLKNVDGAVLWVSLGGGGPSGPWDGTIRLVSGITSTTYGTIAAALAAAVAGDLVLLAQGPYAESITIPANVSVVGTGTTQIVGSGAVVDTVVLNDNSTLVGCIVATPPGAGYAIRYSGLGSASVSSVRVVGAHSTAGGVIVDGAGGILIATVELTYFNGVADHFIRVDNGAELRASVVGFGVATTVTVGVDARGANSIVGIGTISGLVTGGAITDMFQIRDTAKLYVMNGQVSGAPISQSIFRIMADGVELHVYAGDYSATSPAVDILVDVGLTGAGTIMDFCASGSRERWQMPDGWLATAIVSGVISDYTDPEGLGKTEVPGEFSVGMPDSPRESVFGGGDSYTRGMLVYTETSGGVFVNETAAAKTAGASVTYSDLAVNSAIYLASSLNDGSDFLAHPGFKMVQSIAQVGGTIVAEIWDGASYIELATMRTDGGPPFLPHANVLFSTVGTYQIRYNPAAVSPTAGVWTKNDPMALGTSYYWVRFRVTSLLTTAPAFSSASGASLRLHACRKEINKQGFPEYFGDGRPRRRLPWDSGLVQAASNSPANQDVYYGSNVTGGDHLSVGRIENSFVNATTDRIAGVFALPLDLDTSAPIKLAWAWRGTDAGGGNDVVWNVYWDRSSNGTPIATASGGADPATIRTVQVVQAAPATAGDQTSLEVEMDVSNFIAERAGGFNPDFLWIAIERVGGDAADTYTGNAAMIALLGTYTAWNDGGYGG